MLLVTGGAGFIGGTFVRRWLARHDEPVLVLDALTYAADASVVSDLPGATLVVGDIRDASRVASLLATHQPRAVVHIAAETHVDRSIAGPAAFIETNIVGTFRLLEAVRAHWDTLAPAARAAFRLLAVSTDEVYGDWADRGADAPASGAAEGTPYAPSSPYAASKASADHLVRAWARTYGLPAIVTACSNNFGPRQYPEKLIPVVIRAALAGQALPVYGDGQQVRDWLHVDDHCDALMRVLEAGAVGATYHIGGGTSVTNLDLVRRVCGHLDVLRPRADGGSYATQIAFVPDRAGHDRRYALDASRLARELGWRPAVAFDDGLRATVAWYLARS